MKRSTMVELIAEDLLNAPMLYGGDKLESEEVRESTKMSRLKLAHEALKSAEAHGILPPEIPHRTMSDFWVTEWEPENV